MAIGSSCAYLSRNQLVITRVSNYRYRIIGYFQYSLVSYENLRWLDRSFE